MGGWGGGEKAQQAGNIDEEQKRRGNRGGGGGIASAGRTSGAVGAASAQGFRGETPPSVAAGDAVLITAPGGVLITSGIKHQGDNESPRVPSLVTLPGPWDHVPTGVNLPFVTRPERTRVRPPTTGFASNK